MQQTCACTEQACTLKSQSCALNVCYNVSLCFRRVAQSSTSRGPEKCVKEQYHVNSREIPWWNLFMVLRVCCKIDITVSTTNTHLLNTQVYHAHAYIFNTVGNGKTHYIREKLEDTSSHITIAVNEAFTCANAIEKLQHLPNDVSGCAIYFNFTMLPPVVSIDWLTFDIFGGLMSLLN